MAVFGRKKDIGAHSATFLSWVKRWNPDSPETLAYFKQCFPDMHALGDSLWKKYREKWRGIEWPNWLRQYMSANLAADSSFVAEIPQELRSLHRSGEFDDGLKLMIGSFANYFGGLWNNTLNRLQGQPPSQGMGDHFARDIASSRNLESDDIKPFLAKLHVFADQFAYDHPAFQSVLKTQACAGFFIEGAMPFTPSKTCAEYMVASSAIRSIQNGELPTEW